MNLVYRFIRKERSSLQQARQGSSFRDWEATLEPIEGVPPPVTVKCIYIYVGPAASCLGRPLVAATSASSPDRAVTRSLSTARSGTARSDPALPAIRQLAVRRRESEGQEPGVRESVVPI